MHIYAKIIIDYVYARSPAAQLGQSLNLMHWENHAPGSYALREVLL